MNIVPAQHDPINTSHLRYTPARRTTVVVEESQTRRPGRVRYTELCEPEEPRTTRQSAEESIR